MIKLEHPLAIEFPKDVYSGQLDFWAGLLKGWKETEGVHIGMQRASNTSETIPNTRKTSPAPASPAQELMKFENP